ncbi:MAG: nucleotidyltransferase family protein [Rhizobiaceae bacterium]|nr:nucleotidyltransferase family protein [Rhizobiaceae bacterium]
MNSVEIIAVLRRHEEELHRKGAVHAGVFGSYARGDARDDSDIDVLIDLAPDARLGVFDYVGFKEYVAGMFDRRVDVVTKQGLKPHLRPSVLNDTLNAF